MKRLYFSIILLLLYCKYQAQAQPVLEHVETLNKASVIVKKRSLNDSLYTFTNSLYLSIKPYVENKNDGTYFKQFSFCVKINNKGTVDTVLISDNVDYRLRIHISKIQNKLNYTDLIKQAQVKKWYNVNIIIPFIIVYASDKGQNFGDLLKYKAEYLNKMFSFNCDNLLTTHVILLNPEIAGFGTTYQ